MPSLSRSDEIRRGTYLYQRDRTRLRASPRPLLSVLSGLLEQRRAVALVFGRPAEGHALRRPERPVEHLPRISEGWVSGEIRRGAPPTNTRGTGSQRRTSSESRFVATRAPRSSHSSGTGTRAPRLLLTPARRSKWEPGRLLFSSPPKQPSFARLPLSRVTSTLGLFPSAPRHTASRRSSFGASSVARASDASEGRGTRWRPRACAG